MKETSPFAPSFGNRPHQLVGRSREVADLVQGLEGPPGHPNRAMVCLGQRGMGKTALLLEFAALAEQYN
ncbi:MAG: ATP-binding protein, partial [Propionibacteriaceae bacterium]|nr:ATP-binding protein [Propionibacteriaceae bacterium]